MTKKVTQIGLTTNSKKELDQLADRVDRFNRKHGSVLVELEYHEPPQEEWADGGRFRLLFTYKSREIAKNFWLN